MSKKPRVERVAVYYTVHINYPFKCHSAEVALQVREAKNGNPVEVEGKFVCKVRTTWHDVFMFEFSSSKRASHADFTEFIVVKLDMPTEILLPPLPTMELCVDFRLVMCSSQQLKTFAEKLKATFEELLQKNSNFIVIASLRLWRKCSNSSRRLSNLS